MSKQINGNRFLPFREMNPLIVEAIENGFTRKDIASHFNVSISYIQEISDGNVKGVPKPKNKVKIDLLQEDYKLRRQENEKQKVQQDKGSVEDAGSVLEPERKPKEKPAKASPDKKPVKRAKPKVA